MTNWIPDDVAMSWPKSRSVAEFSGASDASVGVQITIDESFDDPIVEADVTAIRGMFAASLEPVGDYGFQLIIRVRERADGEIDAMARALEFVAQQMRHALMTHRG
jgi:hypothetical protein